MSESVRTAAEARLEAAFRAFELEDARPGYRNHLRWLKEAAPEAFERARRHYQDVVAPTIAAGGDDPVTAWVEYGRFLGELSGPGRTLEIAPDGRAHPYEPPARPGALVLFIPDQLDQPALVLSRPVRRTPPQEAALSLLAP